MAQNSNMGANISKCVTT